MVTFRKTLVLAPLALLLVGFAFGQILTFQMTDVDTWPLILTSHMHTAGDIYRTLTQPLMQGRMINAEYFRPLLNLTYAIDAKIWGINPFGYHLTDLLLHWLTGLGVYALTFNLFSQWKERQNAVSLLATVLFLIHPMHIEVVPAIARRAEILTGFFMTFGILFFIKINARPWAYCASVLFFLLGLLAKESFIIFPGIIFFAAFFLRPEILVKSTWQRAVVCLFYSLPFFVILFIYFCVRWWLFDGIGGYLGPKALAKQWLENFVGQPLGLLFPGFHPVWAKTLDFFLLGHWRAYAMAAATTGVLFLFSLVLSLKFLHARWRPKPTLLRPFQSQPVFNFLLAFLGLHVLLLGVFGFNFRYLYLEIIPASILLAWGILLLPHFFSSMTASAFLRPQLFYFFLQAGIIFVAANGVFGSTLFNQSGLFHWKKDALLAHHLYAQIAEETQKKEHAGHTFYLVNFPYQEIAHPWVKFLTVPLSVITLEHAAQGFLDAAQRGLDATPPPPTEKNTRIVGLSYLYIHRPDSILADPAGVMAKLIEPTNDGFRVRVESGGYPVGLPWSEGFGPCYRDRVYRTTRNPADPQVVEIVLLPEAANLGLKRFAFFDGSPTLKFFDNPIDHAQLAQLKEPGI